ncbi:2-hydroxyisoflavanone dehydratase-like [Abrus precatorius]|uniref:2-hydroxyisoflavanone dehydratase-like n=1 Tax=Abrus precatorius TaxID=3816 RepID=A0A8B8M3Y9_ABRPR|nr:2-hydroxyisoflavanone dehydratase-like [Abrus precatorius]
MASDGRSTREVETEILPVIRVYKDGTVERLMGSPIVPTSLQDPQTGVSSKDIVISNDPSISARLYLPSSTQPHHKLPILLYFHGGAFCIESAFSFLDHRYLNLIVSEANVIAVSVEYRLAPEHPLPAAFDDCWEALNWVASQSNSNTTNIEPWLKNHGDLSRIYLGGDSAGANIVHNVALRAGVEALHGNVRILGAFLSHPYFWGSKPVGSEPNEGNKHLHVRVWNFAYPSAPAAIDNPAINPCALGAPNLATLGCSKLLVCVAGKDQLRDRGVWYYEAVKNSEWQGHVELFEVEEEDHAFHIYNTETQNAKIMITRLASFLL